MAASHGSWIPRAARSNCGNRRRVDGGQHSNYIVIMSEERTVTAEIVSIGNSKGLRIPKPIREEVGLEGEVTLAVSEGALIVRPKRAPRADWRQRFAHAK